MLGFKKSFLIKAIEKQQQIFNSTASVKIHIQTKNKEESIQIPLALPLEQLGLLKINNKLKQNFEEKPMIVYRRSRNLKT